MMSTAIGQWRDMTLRVMSGQKSAACGPREGEWAWHLLGSICMLLVVMMAVPPCRLWRGEEGEGLAERSAEVISHLSRYDPHVNKWTEVAPMAKRRAGVGVVALNGYLYAVGGFDDASPLDTVERYNCL